MRRDLTLAGAWTQFVLRGLEACGLDARAICQQCGLAYTELNDPDARVPRDAAGMVWREAARTKAKRSFLTGRIDGEGRAMSTPRRDSCKHRVAVSLTLAGLVSGALLMVAAPAGASVTFFSKSLAKKTNKLYNHDCFWGGPRGMDYALLPDPQPIQVPNLYPDVGSTYFVAQFYLPTGASLTIHQNAPYERYFSFTVASNLPGGGLGNGDFLRDEFIMPDDGSVNPAQPDQPRDAKHRAYTIQVVAGSPPTPRPDNTVYTGITDPNELVHLSMRNYIPDKGKDGTGGVGLPQVTLKLADGTTLSGSDMRDALRTTKAQTANATFPTDQWESLVAAAPDPANFPSMNPVHWERFWNAQYSIAGLFIDDPVLRAATYPPMEAGGLAANPDTRYLFTGTSMNFGEVLVISGKKPISPATYKKAKTWPTEQAPQKVTVPGTEETIMGEYFPTSEYMSKAAFEAMGCPKP